MLVCTGGAVMGADDKPEGVLYIGEEMRVFGRSIARTILDLYESEM